MPITINAKNLVVLKHLSDAESCVSHCFWLCDSGRSCPTLFWDTMSGKFPDMSRSFQLKTFKDFQSLRIYYVKKVLQLDTELFVSFQRRYLDKSVRASYEKFLRSINNTN